MDPEIPHRRQRHARRHPPVGQRHQRDVRLVFALLHAQLATRHRLVRRDFHLHLRALDASQSAVVLLHRLARDPGISRVGVGLFKRRLARARIGRQRVAAGQRIAGLHAVGHALAAHRDIDDKAISASRRHVHHAPAVGGAFQLQPRALRHLALQFHHHLHHVALRHIHVGLFRFEDGDPRVRDAVQIGPRQQRPQKERAKLKPAHKRQHQHPHKDRRGHGDVAFDQRHRQQPRHLQPLHAGGNVRLQQIAKLLRVEDLALRAPQLHR